MTTDVAALTGRVLGGRYTLRDRLGAGGWGAVYAALQNDLGRQVAIKVLHTNVAITTEGLARFEREANQFTSFVFTVAPSGAVTNVVKVSSDSHPKFDTCMLAALRGIRFQALPKGGQIQIGFGARTKDNP